MQVNPSQGSSSPSYRSIVTATIPLPRPTVFKWLCDFGGVNRLLPDFMLSCTCEGDGLGAVRTVHLASGGWVRERYDLSYQGSVFVYSLFENHAVESLPFTGYVSVVLLEDAERGGTLVHWGSNWVPNSPEQEVQIKTGTEELYRTLLANMVAIETQR